MKTKSKWIMEIQSSNFKVNTIKFKFHLLEKQQAPAFQLKRDFYRFHLIIFSTFYMNLS